MLESPAESEFVDFIKQCLEWDLTKRVEALDLLKHEWILQGLPNDIKEQHLRFIAEEEQKMEMRMDKKQKRASFAIRDRFRLF